MVFVEKEKMIYICVRMRDGDQYPSEIHDTRFTEKLVAENTCYVLNKLDYRDDGKWIVISPDRPVIQIEKEQNEK